MTTQTLRGRSLFLSLAMLALTAAMACASPRRGGTADVSATPDSVPMLPTASTTVPQLDSLSPTSAQVPRYSVVEVVLFGRGFDRERNGNTVTMGAVKLSGLKPNTAGTELRFVIPFEITGVGGTQPSPILPALYTVTVTTAAGSSNSLPFRVLP